MPAELGVVGLGAGTVAGKKAGCPQREGRDLANARAQAVAGRGPGPELRRAQWSLPDGALCHRAHGAQASLQDLLLRNETEQAQCQCPVPGARFASVTGKDERFVLLQSSLCHDFKNVLCGCQLAPHTAPPAGCAGQSRALRKQAGSEPRPHARGETAVCTCPRGYLVGSYCP